MDTIYIPRLLATPDQTEKLEFREYVPGLETLTPVQGCLQVRHKGNYLEVSGEAEVIVTLTCDRCLKQFNQRLRVKTSEIIWLQDPEAEDLPLEREVALEDLVEVLPPNGYFDPSEWLYQQLCLEIPPQKLCDRNCSGISATEPSPPSDPPADRRWAGLEALKNQLN